MNFLEIFSKTRQTFRYTGCSQMSGVVSKVNKKYISFVNALYVVKCGGTDQERDGHYESNLSILLRNLKKCAAH